MAEGAVGLEEVSVSINRNYLPLSHLPYYLLLLHSSEALGPVGSLGPHKSRPRPG